LIAVETANQHSVRAHEAAGAVSTGSISGIRILGWTFVRHGRKVKAEWTGRTGYVRVPTSSIAS
jgi:hypothetical protein